MTKTTVFVFVCSALHVLAQDNQVGAVDMRADLLMGIKSGDVAKVSQLLAAGADPNTRIQAGVTALMAATFEGNAEIVRLLLDKGANVNVQSNKGVTALMIAAAKGFKEVAQILLDKGADANIKEESGSQAFQLAAIAGQTEAAELLRKRTKGAANLRIRTIIGPLEGKQKCLPVTKLPDEASQQVACLKAGREVSTGKSKDNKWTHLQKPVSGWVLADKLKRVLVNEAQARPIARRSSEGGAAPSSREESDISRPNLPSAPSSGGGAWWQRQ